MNEEYTTDFFYNILRNHSLKIILYFDIICNFFKTIANRSIRISLYLNTSENNPTIPNKNLSRIEVNGSRNNLE